jgi:hypothetical protein
MSDEYAEAGVRADADFFDEYAEADVRVDADFFGHADGDASRAAPGAATQPAGTQLQLLVRVTARSARAGTPSRPPAPPTRPPTP